MVRLIQVFYDSQDAKNTEVVVVKHDAGKYWRNKKFVKKPGTILLKFFPPIRILENKDVFIRKIKKLFY